MFVFLVLAHFVGDFLLQSDWMALNKGKRWDALALHVAVYMQPFFLLLAFLGLDGWSAASWFVFNGVAHFLADAITSRINARLWFLKMTPAVKSWRVLDGDARSGVQQEQTAYWVDDTGTRHWFFVGIGFDQTIHFVTLFVTADFWLR